MPRAILALALLCLALPALGTPLPEADPAPATAVSPAPAAAPAQEPASEEELPPRESLPGQGPLVFEVLPITFNGRLLVPLRPLFEWLGARVDYSGGVITAYGAGSGLPLFTLTVGRPEALLAGKPYQLDAPPQVVNDRTLVPLRFVAESYGAWVEADGRQVTLRVPQENLAVRMAVAPDPGSHEEKIWRLLARWYDLPGAPSEGAALPHWRLYSRERQAELLATAGAETPQLLEAHWGARGVQGIRVLTDAADPEAGAASAQVLVRYADGGVYQDDFSFVLESDGWKVRRLGTQQLEWE